MAITFDQVKERTVHLSRLLCIKKTLFVERHANLLMFALGVLLLYHGLAELGHSEALPIPIPDPESGGGGAGGGAIEINTIELQRGTCTLFFLMERSFGALLATVAGVGAVVAAAFGAFKAAWSFLVVSIASFILRSLVSMWFGVDKLDCQSLIKDGGSGSGDPSDVI